MRRTPYVDFLMALIPRAPYDHPCSVCGRPTTPDRSAGVPAPVASWYAHPRCLVKPRIAKAWAATRGPAPASSDAHELWRGRAVGVRMGQRQQGR